MNKYLSHAYIKTHLQHRRSLYKNIKETDERENTTFAQKINRPNSLKIVPSGVVNCRNLPFGGRATQGSRVSLPREEGARSHHQHLFEENVGKTGMCGLWTLSVKGSGVVFTHEDGISTPRVRYKGQRPSIKCVSMTSKLRIFPFYVFMYFSFFLCFLAFFVDLFHF